MTATTTLSPFEWAFHYAGPREAVPDSRCVSCRSAKAGECIAEHGKRAMPGCSHCRAGTEGLCHAHWGLDAALAYYETDILPKSCASDYAAVKTLLPTLTKKNVVVDLRSSLLGGHQPREVFVRAVERD